LVVSDELAKVERRWGKPQKGGKTSAHKIKTLRILAGGKHELAGDKKGEVGRPVGFKVGKT